MKNPYGNIYRLVIAAYLLVSLYFLVFSHHGFFLFRASYEDMMLWYPRYHKAVYIFIQAFHFCIAAAFFFLARKVWKHISGFSQLFNNLRIFVREEKRQLIIGKEEQNYRLTYRSHFFISQFLLLFFALLVYFLLKNHAAFYRLFLTRIYLFSALNIFLVSAWINRHYYVSVLVRFLFSPSSPYNLAVYRILFFAILGKEYLNLLTDKFYIIESKPRESLPFIGWLIDAMPISKELYFYFCIAGIVCCIFLVLGLFTRFFLVANAFLVFYIVAVPNFYGKLWHSQLPIWISWFLLFAPIADVFSLDRLFFRNNQPLLKSSSYTFPIKIIWLQIGFIYFWSGFHKLNDGGFDWALSQSMINQVRLEWFENFDKIPLIRFDRYPYMLYAGGMLVIFFELLFWLMLFHRWLKYVSIIGGLLMHNILKMVLYIGFKELQIQYIVFVNFERVFLFLRKIIPSISLKENFATINTTVSAKLIIMSAVVIGMNSLCGLFQVNSFPFSVYPTYSEIIPAEKEFLHYTVLDKGKENMDVLQLGKNSGFNWEHFARLEYAIINKYHERNEIDSIAVVNQWKWWANQLPELKAIDTVDVYIYRRPLNPDSAEIILDKHYLFRLYTHED